jgi:formylglycine-generating enzyme required for sulfatase activity
MNISKPLKNFVLRTSSFVLITLLTSAAFAAEVSSVIVRQQWPWSTDIKVEYALSGVDASHPVNISVRAFNGDTELDSAALASAITGRLNLITSPVGSFMIDPVAAFGTSEVALGNFRVRLLLSDAMEDVLYKIVDLDPPYTITNVKRKDFYNGTYQDFVTSYSDIYSTFTTSLPDVLIWRGVTNDIYKTDKMVFRRIPAAGKSFNFQNNTNKVVTFTKDFYIGVFEVTQSQQAKFYSRESWETNALYAAKRPATRHAITTLRGSGTWPDNKTHTDCQNYDCLAGNMQKATGLRVDLPTEAMWEYACRAGTTTTLYTGTTHPVNTANRWMSLLLYRGRWCNRADNNYGNDAATRNSNLSDCTAAVGTYLPNAFGLYDMLGNALELCLDRWSDSPSGGTDPVGTTSTADASKNYCVGRGGSANTGFGGVQVSARAKKLRAGDNSYVDNGGRLCIWLGDNDDGEL